MFPGVTGQSSVPYGYWNIKNAYVVRVDDSAGSFNRQARTACRSINNCGNVNKWPIFDAGEVRTCSAPISFSGRLLTKELVKLARMRLVMLH
jgi:hypothetical protein